MKIDKISVVLLVWIGICSVLAVVLPAMAENQATQTATTTQAQTINIMAQNNITNLTGWSFRGAPGSTNDTPVNSNNEKQQLSTPWKPVAVLHNNGSVTYNIILNAGQFNDTGVATVAGEKYNVTNTSFAPAAGEITGSLIAGTDVNTTNTILGNNGLMSLWLQLTFGNSANKTASSTFSVLAET